MSILRSFVFAVLLGASVSCGSAQEMQSLKIPPRSGPGYESLGEFYTPSPNLKTTDPGFPYVGRWSSRSTALLVASKRANDDQTRQWLDRAVKLCLWMRAAGMDEATSAELVEAGFDATLGPAEIVDLLTIDRVLYAEELE